MEERGQPLDPAAWARIRTSGSVGWMKFRRARRDRYVHLVVTGASNMRLVVYEGPEMQARTNSALKVHFDGTDVTQALDALASASGELLQAGFRKKDFTLNAANGQYITTRIAEIAKARRNISEGGLSVD